MRNHSAGLLVLFIAILGTACLRNPEKQIGAHDYYDIKGLFDQQNEMLRSESPLLLKKVRYGEKFEEKQLRPDSLDWHKELNMFYDVNPNLAANKTKYQERYEMRGGDIQLSYFPEDSANAELKSLQISLNPKDSAIQGLRAILRTKNYLTKEEVLLEASFDDQRPPMIKEYFIRTGQKVVTKDSSHYSLIGEIVR
jgi:hypothetical protein